VFDVVELDVDPARVGSSAPTLSARRVLRPGGGGRWLAAVLPVDRWGGAGFPSQRHRLDVGPGGDGRGCVVVAERRTSSTCRTCTQEKGLSR